MSRNLAVLMTFLLAAASWSTVACASRGTGENTCSTNADCAEPEFCAKPQGGCDAAAGTCRARPELCTQDYTPVCGCDGKTYGNGCTAAAVGINVAHTGACE